jgi:hypothetical protein
LEDFLHVQGGCARADRSDRRRGRIRVTGLATLAYLLGCDENCQAGDRVAALPALTVALAGLVPTVAYVVATMVGSKLMWPLLAVAFGV